MTITGTKIPTVTNGERQDSVTEKFDALLDKLGFAQKPGVLDGAGVNGLFTNNATSADQVAAKAPEIDAASAAANDSQSENIESVTTKLTTGGLTHKTVMFDMYALMELMQEMAQEMRNAMRELRQTELSGIQANLQAQAQVQKKAAITQMCLGIAAGVAQFAFSTYGTYKSVAGVKSELGLSSDQTKLTVATNEVKLGGALECDTPLQAAKTQMATVRAETGLTESTVDSKLTQSGAALNRAKTVFNSEATVENRAAAFKQLTGKDVVWAEGEGPKTLSAESMGEVKSALVTAFDADMVQFSGNPGMQKMGRAIQLKNTAEISPELGKSVGAEIKSAGADRMVRIQTERGDVTNIQIDARKAQALGGLNMQLGMMLGQVGQTIATSIGQNIQAEGSKLQAEKAAMEERLDQDKDLFANCLQLVEKTIQIFSGVTQAEASSIRDIMA